VDLELTGKIAIVTGSSRGLGLASAAALIQEGCRVTICARGEARLDEVAGELRRKAADDSRVRPADLASVMALPPVAQRSKPRRPRHSGQQRRSRKGASITETSDAEWHEALDQTLSGDSLPGSPCRMRRRGGGAIVMIASIWGRESGGRMTYNAVKAAEISLAKSMAQQLASDNIRVNSVAPGSILFPGGSWHLRQQEDPAGIAAFVRRELPFGRFGRPEEVGSVVAFLVSPRASWISGASVPVDGCQSRSLI
jgi:3-oxoacyl-[acyl-carrier protein] reductase